MALVPINASSFFLTVCQRFLTVLNDFGKIDFDKLYVEEKRRIL